MADVSDEVQLGAQGRIVIPASLRKAMNLQPGERLIARISAEGLVLERREHVETRLWQMFADASENRLDGA